MTMDKKQMDLFKAETTWFHVFVSMIENGDVAKMGPYAVTVYLVVKAYTNWKTGKAFPSIETIAEKSGISRRQVINSLATLAENGYIDKTKVGIVARAAMARKMFETADHAMLMMGLDPNHGMLTDHFRVWAKAAAIAANDRARGIAVQIDHGCKIKVDAALVQHGGAGIGSMAAGLKALHAQIERRRLAAEPSCGL